MVLVLNTDGITRIIDVSSVNVRKTPKGEFIIDFIWGVEHQVYVYTGNICTSRAEVTKHLIEHHTLDDFTYIGNTPVSNSNVDKYDDIIIEQRRDNEQYIK